MTVQADSISGGNTMQDIMNDPKAIAETAIANEIEGRAMLERGKNSATTPLAKATFEFLANEELKHIALIKQFAESLTGTTKWCTDDLGEGLDINQACTIIKHLNERYGTEFETVGGLVDERLKVYQVAMDMERQGYAFYSNAAKHATNEQARELCQFLADEEAKHFEILQDTHDFLQQPDALLAMEERWMQI